MLAVVEVGAVETGAKGGVKCMIAFLARMFHSGSQTLRDDHYK